MYVMYLAYGMAMPPKLFLKTRLKQLLGFLREDIAFPGLDLFLARDLNFKKGR